MTTRVKAKSKKEEPVKPEEGLVKVQWFVRPIHDKLMRHAAAENKRNISSQVQVELDEHFHLDKDGNPTAATPPLS